MKGLVLKAIITERKKTVKEIADKLGITADTLYAKMRGDAKFNYDEIVSIKKELNLTPEEFNIVFPF